MFVSGLVSSINVTVLPPGLAVTVHKPVPCDEMAGYRATYLGELAIKSINEGRPLPVPVDKWDYFVEL